MRLVWAAILVVVTAAGCTPQQEPNDAAEDSTAAPVVALTPPDSAKIRAAMDVLSEFLDASREGSPARSQLPSLTACPSGDAQASGPMLARFEVLEPSLRADTVVGRAVVTTVADQDVDRIHPGYFVARLRVRSDTLEWDVLRSESSGWVVCNGLSFGLTAPESLTTWRPTGASALAARALADSIRLLRP